MVIKQTHIDGLMGFQYHECCRVGRYLLPCLLEERPIEPSIASELPRSGIDLWIRASILKKGYTTELGQAMVNGFHNMNPSCPSARAGKSSYGICLAPVAHAASSRPRYPSPVPTAELPPVTMSLRVGRLRALRVHGSAKAVKIGSRFSSRIHLKPCKRPRQAGSNARAVLRLLRRDNQPGSCPRWLLFVLRIQPGGPDPLHPTSSATFPIPFKIRPESNQSMLRLWLGRAGSIPRSWQARLSERFIGLPALLDIRRQSFRMEPGVGYERQERYYDPG
jgi:hypothetical protein